MIKTILSRASVRNFTGGKIAKKDLEKIVKAGMAAPSAVNTQPWRVIVISERGILDELAKGLLFARMLKSASAAIVVCADYGINPFSKKYWVQDCSAMSQNILLAVHSLGYGAVWTGVYPSIKKEGFVRKVLSIPDKIRVLNVIPIGIPKEKVKPKDKYDTKKIYWQSWK